MRKNNIHPVDNEWVKKALHVLERDSLASNSDCVDEVKASIVGVNEEYFNVDVRFHSHGECYECDEIEQYKMNRKTLEVTER
jgi:hypothetical protein